MRIFLRLSLCFSLPTVFLLASGEIAEEQFKHWDTNGDGRLDKGEMAATREGEAHLGEGDPKWQNGGVPIAELARQIRQQWKENPEQAKAIADKLDADGALEKELEAADANRDGKIDHAENEQLLVSTWFKLFDSNGDGFLSPEEAAKIP